MIFLLTLPKMLLLCRQSVDIQPVPYVLSKKTRRKRDLAFLQTTLMEQNAPYITALKTTVINCLIMIIKHLFSCLLDNLDGLEDSGLLHSLEVCVRVVGLKKNWFIEQLN